MEILSDMLTCSLEGVPGGLMDATLGCRDGSFPAKTAEGVGNVGVATIDCGGGVSAFGVCVKRSVLGAVLMAGELTLGDSGFDAMDGVCDTVRCEILLGVPVSTGVDDDATAITAVCP